MQRLLLLLLVLAGCGGATPPATVEVPPTITVAPEHAQVASEVVLDSPGEGTPSVLRFAPVVGQRQTIVMTMDVESGVVVNGEAGPVVRAPQITITSETHVTEVAADGVFRIENLITDLDVSGDPNDPTVQAYQQQLGPLARLHGWSVLDPRGRVMGLDLVIPDDLEPSARQSVEGVRDALRQLLPPMPVEPVALGARWHSEGPITTAQGTSFVQRTEYELAAIDERSFTLAVRIDQRAEPQPLPVPDPSVVASLLAMESRGAGRVSLLRDGQLRTSDVDLRTQMQMQMVRGDDDPMQLGTQLHLVTHSEAR